MRARIVLEEVCHSNAQGSPIVPIVMAKGVEQTIALALMGLKHALGAACAMKTRMFSRIPKKNKKISYLSRQKKTAARLGASFLASPPCLRETQTESASQITSFYNFMTWMNQELNLFELAPLKLWGPDAKEFQNKTSCLDTIPLCMACPTHAIMKKDFKPYRDGSGNAACFGHENLNHWG